MVEGTVDVTKQHHLATAEDFRRAAEADAFEAPRRIVLPHCGLGVLLRRPRPAAFALAGFPLPPEGDRGGDAAPEGPVSSERLEAVRQSARAWSRLLERVFVQPGLSLTPGPSEIHPNWIPEPDADFLLGWCLGRVGDDAAGYQFFRAELRAGGGEADAGRDGGPVPLPAERAAEGND